MDNDARIRRFVPIQRLPKAFQDKAVQLAEIRQVGRGQVIYTQGSSDDAIYYLLSGTIDLLWHGKSTRTLSATNKAALRPLDPPGRKRYSVRAVDSASVVVFKRVLLDRLVTQADASAADELEVSEIATARSSNWMIRMLQSELFSVLPATNIQRIFARMEQVAVSADEVIVQQETVGDFYYVIEKGYCEVSRSIAGGRGQIHLADLGPGAAFGEEALIANRPRNASVTMLSDGLLMRVSKDDFVELIVQEVLHPVDFSRAQQQIAAGAVWLDIRYPEEHAARAFIASENIPVNMLRLQSNRLRKDFRYIICGSDIEEAAIAAFLLAERGFNVAYLNETVGAIAERAPQHLTGPLREPAPAVAAIMQFPGAELADSPTPEEAIMDPQEERPLDNTISRIAGLSTHAEAEREMQQLTPIEQFTDTATGRDLADIIDQLGARHDQLAGIATSPLAATELDRAAPPAMPAARLNEPPRDAIGLLMQQMEERVRREIEQAVAARTAQLEANYRSKLRRMRALTNEEIRRKEARLREHFANDYADKEQLLRSYYKKLIGLANKISKQKAQLQEARKQFELKLTSANQLYREIEEMRQLLTDQFGYLDEQAIEEIPALAISL